MTTDHLRDELARIADDAPHVDVPDHTWGRARRARRRDLVLTTTAAVAAVAVLAGAVGLWFPRGYDTPPADGGGSGAPAVPDRLHDVPAGFADDHATTDLAVGRGAVAWYVDSGVAVVVDAADGDYHLLRLPGSSDLTPALADAAGTPLAVLSPDGASLAHPRDGGLGLVDLVSGEARQVDLADYPISIEGAVFSASGAYLAWRGSRTDGDGDASSVVPLAGVVDVATGRSTSGVAADGDAIAVSDAGRLERIAPARLGTWQPGPVAVLDGDGTALLGAGSAQDGATAAALVRRPGAEGEGVVLEADRGERPSVPLGWSADDEPLVALAPGDTTRLVLLSDDGERTVATAEDGVPLVLSVATDLVDGTGVLSVERPDPDFPPTHARLWAFLITAGIGVAILAMMAFTAGAWSNRFSGAAAAASVRTDR